MLYGQGRNGKSVFLALLQALVGKVNTSAESLQRIEFDKYRSAKLYGKLVNICGDIPDTKMHKSEVFKKLTSGLDDIDGENKYQDSFTFKNTAKLIFSANILPEGKKDKAYYRRWRLVEFPHEFAGDNEDKLIIEKLTCKTELSGLLNLALGGLKRLLKNGRFSYDKSVEDTEKTYMLNSNPVAFFMDQFTEVGGDDCEANDLFYAYLGWCEREHKKVVSNIEFSRRLSKMGYSSHRDNVPLGERTYKKVTMWDNLTIKYDELDRISSKNDEISCPNCINSTDTVKTDVGQDRQDLPLPRLEMENNKIKSNNENEENRTVEESKKGVFSNCLENSVTIKDSSCPKVRKCDSERQRTGCVDKIEKDPVQQEEITDFLENKEDYSGENLSFCESLRRDLKNFARSHYNFIVEDIFEFVREFNKNCKAPSFPGLAHGGQ
jgi:putative DNA primase/helicase